MTRPSKYRVVRYAFAAPALFVPIDGRNRTALGLAGGQRRFAGYEPYQAAAYEIFGGAAGVFGQASRVGTTGQTVAGGLTGLPGSSARKCERTRKSAETHLMTVNVPGCGALPNAIFASALIDVECFLK